MTQRPPGIDRRVVAAIAAVVVAALIAVIVWAASSGDDDDTSSDAAEVSIESTAVSTADSGSTTDDGTPPDSATSASDTSAATTSGDATTDTTVTGAGTTAPTATTQPTPTSPATTGAPATAPITAPATEPPVEVSLDDDAELGGGVEVAVTQIESVEGEAQGVGERSGPSLRITVALTNGTDAELATDLALVNLYYGEDLIPATPLSGPGVESFPQTAAPGETVTGRLVFLVPEEERDHVVIEFSYSTESPKAVFTGPVA